MSKPRLTYDECEEIIGELFTLSLGTEEGILKFDNLLEEDPQKYSLIQFYDTHCIPTDDDRLFVSREEIDYDSFSLFADKVVTRFDLHVIEKDELESWYKLYFTEYSNSEKDYSDSDSFCDMCNYCILCGLISLPNDCYFHKRPYVDEICDCSD